MKIIKPSYEIIDTLDATEILKKIELCGRVCYKSEDKITENSAREFVKRIIKSGHESVLEHFSFSVRFVTDRGISHEIVRHRLASYSQESTRYCNYGNDKFNGEITVVEPHQIGEQKSNWHKACELAEEQYFELLKTTTPQTARAVLPTCLKTELIMTANLREWRHFLRLRASKAAHPDMRVLTIPLLKELKQLIPVVFDDIYEEEINND